MLVYLAGPAVFLPDAAAHGAAKKALCAQHGFRGWFPLDSTPDLAGCGPFEQGMRIAAANEAAMRECDFAIADMTPFRGASMDVGTAYEMGFVRALGKPVLGYSNVAAGFRSRSGPADAACDAWEMAFESFDMADNLMLHAAVHDSGVALLCAEMAPAERFTSLAVFERVLAQARARFQPG